MSRTRLALLIVGALTAACARQPTSAPQPSAAAWFATWSASQFAGAPRPPADSVDRTPTYVNRTLREVVRATLSGNAVRIRLSNEYGDRPLTIGAAHVAVRDTGAAIVMSTDREITFGGKPQVTIRPGATIVSDGVALDVPALGELAVSLYLSDSARVVTRHALALQTSYVSGAGDLAGTLRFAADTMRIWPFLSGVDVTNPAATGVIVALGNSITDGAASTVNTNRRWPDILAQRLLASAEPAKGVANAGISGNRVLSFGTGPSALARFDRDVLAQPGATHLIVLEGINDIGRSVADNISAADLIFGLHQLADRAHERGLVVIGATLTPAGPRPQFTPDLEAKRVAVNTWIRTSGVFDGVIDFDAAVRDPAMPTRMLPAYDSGDHLHPGDAGYKAMGEAIDLTLFQRRR